MITKYPEYKTHICPVCNIGHSAPEKISDYEYACDACKKPIDSLGNALVVDSPSLTDSIERFAHFCSWRCCILKVKEKSEISLYVHGIRTFQLPPIQTYGPAGCAAKDFFESLKELEKTNE